MDIREQTEDDFEHVQRIRKLAFGRVNEDAPRIEPGSRGLVAALDGRPAGVLGIGEYAQFFGGRAVPMGGIGGVAVDPYARGRGVASQLLDTALRTMREHGQVLSVLYPTVPELYRTRGWDRAGVFEWTTLPMDRLLAAPKPGTRLRAEPATENTLKALHECYVGLARTVNGMIDRRPPRVDVSKVLEMDTVSVLPGDDGTVRGYLTAQRQSDGGLKVFDLIGTDPDAQLSLLAELKSWTGIVENLQIRITDPGLLSFLTSQQLRYDVGRSTWLMRVVDLPAAVAARGWPTHLRDSAVDIEVVDETAPWHAGRHRIVVEDGSVRCEPGGSGAVTMTARALGPWFSGMHDTHALRRAGLLDGDPADAALLDQLAAAPGVPRLADFF
ncbi:GNAT family N-acetyltransferase [Lentzea tibetensis]|uniref:GNAT family N-acetyltransferase n=1 Tax=Lentzea tibetensis TaxID=2591470 RepID=A0A563EQK9_9PSEU|nr:GNAT family N-acetyltransferase [Lentzea tibetensis]TWP49940.1 GNAT family N-acetyltransferase [Lentzea tibetensis]